MAKNKTAETNVSVADFIHTVDNRVKRDDALQLVEIFKSVSGFEPKMWGPSIIGFGSYHYKYDSGHEGDAPLAGFSPRKDALTLYFATEFEKRDELLSRLGKHKATKSCVYVKKLADIDKNVLVEMIANSIAHVSTLYPNRPS